MKLTTCLPVIAALAFVTAACDSGNPEPPPPPPEATFEGLGTLGDAGDVSVAFGVSADGLVTVGQSQSENGLQAFRWVANPAGENGGMMMGLGFLPGGASMSNASAASANGSVIVGYGEGADGLEAFRWEDGAMASLGDLAGGNFYSVASGISSDGSIIVGTSESMNGFEAFRWEDGAMAGLGDLAGGSFSSWPVGIYANGSIIVGYGSSANGYEAFRWEDGAMAGLGDLPGGAFESRARGASTDGSVIVGDGTSANGNEAFRWENGTMSGLGDLPGGPFSSRAYDVSADGSIVVGEGTANNGDDAAFIWTASDGMLNLKTVLEGEYGLDLTGWKLFETSGISDDGDVIVGYGENPDGDIKAWLAFLGAPVGTGAVTTANYSAH